MRLNRLCTPDCPFFVFNDTATTEIYTLSLHDALPIWLRGSRPPTACRSRRVGSSSIRRTATRSEEHTSELQPHVNLVCRLLLEKNKQDLLEQSGKTTIDQMLDSLATSHKYALPLFEHFAHRQINKRVVAFRFFFNDTATTEIYTLSLHDALPI